MRKHLFSFTSPSKHSSQRKDKQTFIPENSFEEKTNIYQEKWLQSNEVVVVPF
jgi:hypothetical protein